MSRRLCFFWLLALLAAGALVGCRPAASYHGAVWSPPQAAADFTLSGVSGPVSLSDFAGQVVLLYFGYTFCPDICPTTMADVARATAMLGERASRVQVVMITVDPTRDTAAQLDAYLDHFDPAFIGLTGSEAEIAEVAAAYGVFFSRHEGTAATGYLVDHTSRVFVIDPDGQQWLSFPYGQSAAEMASDLEHVLDGAGPPSG